MTNRIAILVATLACIATASTAASAATPAVATTNVNLRAGPSTHFPVVKVVPAGARLVTFGCVKGYTWCDVSFAGNRGWLAARYVRLAGPGV
ncbi:MAG: SH3 domain-containing protein, partial [Pseudomonadota bacterium]